MTAADRWETQAQTYKRYIKLEKNLSPNTIESYMRDLSQFYKFILDNYNIPSQEVKPQHIEHYLAQIYDSVEKSTQARTLSGIKSFFNFLVLTDEIDTPPTDFIDSPKAARHLPDTLSTEEIDQIIATIDLSQPQGERNRAILETMYGCGLRVSEVISLRLSDLNFDEGFISVVGKGNKQRLVPINSNAIKYINNYLSQRCHMNIDQKWLDTLFLNRNGRKLTREMIFTILKRAAQSAGISKRVSPHTLRHSFATHLLIGGASIRHVQQLLGHESISTTDIYTHLELSHLRDSIEEHHPLGDRY